MQEVIRELKGFLLFVAVLWGGWFVIRFAFWSANVVAHVLDFLSP